MKLTPGTLELIRMIGSPFSAPTMAPEESEVLYQRAFKNRIGLLYLGALNAVGRLKQFVSQYEILDLRARETLVTVTRLADVLNRSSIPYVVVKTLRPYPATPNDVDVVFLGRRKDFGQLVAALVGAGYVVAPEEPGTLQRLFMDARGNQAPAWDKRGGTYYVDVYEEMATDYFVYADKKTLGNARTSLLIDSAAVSVLRPEVELSVILWHSVFPENTYALEVFYTTCHSFLAFTNDQVEEFLRFVRHSHFAAAVRANLSITLALHREALGFEPPLMAETLRRLGGINEGEITHLMHGNFDTPHKFAAPTFVCSLLEQATKPSGLASLAVQGLHMLDPRFAWGVVRALRRKFTQETYVQV